MLRVGERKHLAAKLPVDQVARRVAGNITLAGIVGLRAVLAEPVVDALEKGDAAAVRLNALTAIVEPWLARLDEGRRGREETGRQREQQQR